MLLYKLTNNIKKFNIKKCKNLILFNINQPNISKELIYRAIENIYKTIKNAYKIDLHCDISNCVNYYIKKNYIKQLL